MQTVVDQIDNNELINLMDLVEAELERRKLPYKSRAQYRDIEAEKTIRKKRAENLCVMFLESVEHYGKLEKEADVDLALEMLNNYSEDFSFCVHDDYDVLEIHAVAMYKVLAKLYGKLNAFIKLDLGAKQFADDVADILHDSKKQDIEYAAAMLEMEKLTK